MIHLAAVRLAGMVLAYAFTVLLTRSLGADGFGIFVTSLSIAAILATVSGFGLPTLATRDIARMESDAEIAVFKTTAVRCVVAVVLCTFVVALGWLLVAPAHLLQPSLYALAIFPPLALIRLRQGIAIPIVGAARALLPEQILLPLLAILAIASAMSVMQRQVAIAIAIYSAAAVIALVVGNMSMGGTPPPAGPAFHPSPRFADIRSIARRSLPFLLSELPNAVTVNIDVIVVSALLGVRQAAIYAVAVRLANLISFPVSIVNMTYMPRYAASHHPEQIERLRAHAREASLIALASGALIAAGLLATHPWLTALFGQGFEEVAPILLVLSAVRVATCAFAPNEAVLLMTGGEGMVVFVAWIRAGLLMALTAIGALHGSLVAASIGTATAILIVHALIAFVAWRYGRVFAYPAIAASRLRALVSGKL